MMTVAIICGFLPTFFLSPFAGVWADRYNRKVLIVLADASIALATLVLALLFLAGYKMLWLLFFMSAIRSSSSTCRGSHAPANCACGQANQGECHQQQYPILRLSGVSDA